MVEYVKQGNKLCLSEAIPEDLRELLSRCWEYVAKERPTIGDIVEILEETPDLISPYLEAPVASIPQEGGGSELVSMPWAAERASQQPQGTAQQPQTQQQPQLTYPGQNGTHGGGGDAAAGGGSAPKRAKTTKSLSSFSDGQHQPRSPLGRNFSHPSTTSTTTTSQDHCFMEMPASLESHHNQKLPSDNKGGRFFLRSNSEDVSDSNSPPPTPTAQITSFFNSAVNSAAQALRKQPSKTNSLGFSSTPSPSASGLTTPMTLTPTKHPIHPNFQSHELPSSRHHHHHHNPSFHHHRDDAEPGGGGGGDVCVSPPDLFPLRPLSNSSHGQDTTPFPGGFAKPQLMASPTALAQMPASETALAQMSYSRNNPPSFDPATASNDPSYPLEDLRKVPPVFYG